MIAAMPPFYISKDSVSIRLPQVADQALVQDAESKTAKTNLGGAQSLLRPPQEGKGSARSGTQPSTQCQWFAMPGRRPVPGAGFGNVHVCLSERQVKAIRHQVAGDQQAANGGA